MKSWALRYYTRCTLLSALISEPPILQWDKVDQVLKEVEKKDMCRLKTRGSLAYCMCVAEVRFGTSGAVSFCRHEGFAEEIRRLEPHGRWA